MEKKCNQCNKSYPKNPKYSKKQWERSKYCSFRCGGIAMRKRQITSWNKGKKCPQIGGKNHHRWKGGITQINGLIRKSAEYKDWREKVFKRDDFTCQMCGSRKGDKHADHIKPFSLFPELRFDVSNGRTLCKPCHRKTDTYGHKLQKYKIENGKI